MKKKTRIPPKECEPKKGGAARGRFWKNIFDWLISVIELFPPPVAKILRAILDWALKQSRLVRVLLCGTVALGLLVYWLRDPIGKLRVVHEFNEAVEILYERIVPPHIPVAVGDQFSVGMTWLDGDPELVAFKSLDFAVRGLRQVDVLPIERRLRLGGSNPRAALKNAQETAGRWLEKSRADVIIWGEVEPGGGDMRLYITPRNGPTADRAGTPGRELNMTVPKDGKADFNAVIVTQLFGFLAPFNPSRVIAPNVAEAIKRFEKIVDESPEGAPRANLAFALANAESILGEQQANEALVGKAVGRYRQLLKAPPTEKIKFSVAELRNNLGNALWSLGKLSQDEEEAQAQWKGADAQFAAAAREYELDNKPESRAVTLNNRGLALQSLGRVKEAVDVYEEALTKLSAPVTPTDWAMVQNNLGNALFLMGEDDVSEEGTMQLHKAKRVFEKALAIWAKGQMPLSRAMTHNNLGNVLSALGQRETSAQGATYLRDSIVAYEQALKEYTPDRTYLARDRAMARYNLGLAQLVLGERENDPVQLGKAVEALRASLPHRQQALRIRAQTERNLGLALYQCGGMETAPTEIPSRWKEAAAAFRSAIEHYGLAGETFEAAVTGIRLGLVLTDWAAREGTREARLARWREAIEVFEEALRVPGLENHSDYYGAVQRHLWEAQRREAEARAQAGTGSL